MAENWNTDKQKALKINIVYVPLFSLLLLKFHFVI